MDRASYYREKAEHLRRLADLTWQPKLEAMLRDLALDYDKVAHDLEVAATDIGDTMALDN